MMAYFIQRGEAVDFTPSRDVEAGEVIMFGGMPGVVRLRVRKGELGALALTGVYDFSKKAGEAMHAGGNVFWDASGCFATSSQGGGCFLGIAAANSPPSSGRVRVILNFGGSAPGTGGGSGGDSASDWEWQTL